MNTFVGILIGAVILAIAYAGVMLAYFAARKRFSSTKYLVEIVTVVVVLVLSAAVKFVIVKTAVDAESNMPILEDTVWNNMAIFFHSLYQGIGGLSLEGLADLGDIDSGIIRCLYTGTSVLGALVFVSVITATASYEIYSYVQLLFDEKRNNIFVFTSLTEESLTLAKSIKEQYESAKLSAHQNGTECTVCKPKIVFAGACLEPFDRHDPLCREVSANGFLYWSYFQKDGDAHSRSIAKALHLNNGNFADYDKHFVVFAFGSEEHVPVEEDNMNLVFRDIDCRLNAKKSDRLRIEYYILTKREVNYLAYDQKINECQKLLSEHAERFDGVKKLSQVAVVDVFNEAYVIGKNAVRDIMDAGLRSELASSGDKFKDELVVWALGFGGVAESITRELFVQSPGIDSDGNSRKYIADVYDRADHAVGSPAGLFKLNHPDYLVTSRSSGEAKATCSVTEFIKYADAQIAEANKTRPGLPHPVFRFNDIDCCSQEFIESLDYGTGSVGKFGHPDIIIVATGDDYRNIRITNAITQDIINERVGDTSGERWHRQYIVVNLFDDNNNDLISRYGKSMSDGNVIDISEANLAIIIAGNLQDTYDYAEFMRDEGTAAWYNYSYNRVSADKEAQTAINSFIAGTYDRLVAPYDVDANAVSSDLNAKELAKVVSDHTAAFRKEFSKYGSSACGKEAKSIAAEDFYAIDLWRRESNRSSSALSRLYNVMFSEYVAERTDGCSVTDAENECYAYLSAVEHDRWIRHHYSDGWVYNEKKRKDKKQHLCLLSYFNAPKYLVDTFVYDYLNVVWSVANGDKNPS